MKTAESKSVPSGSKQTASRPGKSFQLFAAAVISLSILSGASASAQDNEWIGGTSTDYHNASNWSLGVVPTSIQNAIIDNSMTDTNVVISSSTSVGSVTINSGDQLSVSNNRTLTFEGLGGPTIFANDGQFSLNSTGSTTSLVLNQETLLSGMGILNLNGTNARITSGNESILHQNAGHTIQGSGAIGFNTMGIVNDGLIHATMDTMAIDPDANGLVNNGVLRADGGNLLLDGFGDGDVSNSGTIEALNGSNVILQAGINIDGGILTTSGSSQIQVGSGGAGIKDLTNNGTIQVLNTRSLTVEGAIENQGTINLATTGSVTSVQLNGDTGFSGSGTLSLAGSNARIQGTGTVFNNDSHQIVGQGNVGNNVLGIVNNSIIDANVAGTLSLDPADGLNLVNNGTLQATNGGNLLLSGFGGGTFQNNGNIFAADGSQVTLTADANVSGGTLTTSGTGRFLVASGNAAIADTTVNGNLQVENSRTLGVVGSLVNNGLIQTNSSGSTTSIVANGDTLLDGTGTLRLQNTAATLSGTAGHLLTQGSQHTIAGHGNLGGNQLTISNSGTIIADTGVMEINPGVGGLENLSNITATSGGRVLLNGFGGGQFMNSGTISADDASIVELENGATVIGGNLGSTGTGSFLISSGDGRFQNLTNDAAVTIENTRSLNLAGTIVNNGAISTASFGSITNLFVDSDTTLTGNGSVNLQNVSARLNGVAGSLLTNDTNHSIVGYGDVGFNNLELVNNGLITADGGTINLDPESVSGLTNNGTIQAESGSTILLNGFGGGEFQNAAGTVVAKDGGQIQFQNNASLVGGLLRSEGSGNVLIGTSNGTISDLTADASIVIGNTRSLNTNGTIVNNGSITTNSVGSITQVSLNSDTTFEGNGEVRLQNVNARLTGSSGLNLTNGTGHSLTGLGNVGFNQLGIQNQGTISADVAGGLLVVDPGAAGLNNTGVFRAENGGTLQFDSFGDGAFGGTGSVEAYDGSSVIFESGSVVNNLSGGTLDSGSWGAWDSGSGATIDFQQATTPITQVGAGATVTLSGAAAQIVGNGQSFSNTIESNFGQINLASGHTVSVAAFENAGQLNVDGMGTNFSAGDFTQTAGVTDLINGGSVTGNMSFQAGILQGNGTLYGSVALESASEISAGHSAGILNIEGNSDIYGLVDIEIAGANIDGMMQDEMLVNRGIDFSLADFDQINVMGDLFLDGTLELSFIEGYELAGSQFYDVITADSLTLGSSFVLQNNTAADFTFSVETLTDSVSGTQRDVLRLSGFSAVPEPTGVGILAGLVGGVLLRRRRRTV